MPFILRGSYTQKNLKTNQLIRYAGCFKFCLFGKHENNILWSYLWLLWFPLYVVVKIGLLIHVVLIRGVISVLRDYDNARVMIYVKNNASSAYDHFNNGGFFVFSFYWEWQWTQVLSLLLKLVSSVLVNIYENGLSCVAIYSPERDDFYVAIFLENGASNLSSLVDDTLLLLIQIKEHL